MAHYYTRRRENLIDLAFDPSPLHVSGVDGYRIKHATNWDGSFSKLVDIPVWGGRSSSVPNTYNPGNIQNRYVRYLFDPADFSLEDDTVHYLKITSLDGASEKQTGRTLIVLTPGQVGTERPVLVLRGEAPVAGDYDSGEHLYLPSTAVSYEIDNMGASTVFLGFSSENSELKVTSGSSKSDNKLQESEVNLRTESGASNPSEVQLFLVLAQGPSL